MTTRIREETTDAALKEAREKLDIALKEINRLSESPSEEPAVVAWRSEKDRLEDRIKELRDKPRPKIGKI